MDVALVTGVGGLIGSEAASYFVQQGYFVVGLDNDMRAKFFGPEASTAPKLAELHRDLGQDFRWLAADIRDRERVEAIFVRYGTKIKLVVHAAAQPSHDWAAKDPHTDFGVNAVGTLNLLDASRKSCPDATFIHCSTSKVYGDNPNDLPLQVWGERYDLKPSHRYYHGITPDMSIDHCLHSLFGVSKASADLLVQEYGRYFDMPTVCFRPGCLTGPAHAGAELHGFLSYLMRCAITGQPYTIYGYDGLQVRCNIHSLDLVKAFAAFHKRPTAAAVYNIGGGRENACSMIEAIRACEDISGNEIKATLKDKARIGDHMWWISDNQPFEKDYPHWDLTVSLDQTLREIHDVNREQWEN